MSRFLLDTNVISARAPRAVPDPSLTSWLDMHEDVVAISVVTVAEVESGIAKLKREGALRKAAEFARWLDDLETTFAGRVLPLDLQASRLTGALQDKARSLGHDPGFADLAIAGTALRYGLTLATRNIRHFSALGIAIVDPSRQGQHP